MDNAGSDQSGSDFMGGKLSHPSYFCSTEKDSDFEDQSKGQKSNGRELLGANIKTE